VGSTWAVLKNWETRYQFYNPTNLDVGITCYELYVKNDVPFVYDLAYADAQIAGGTIVPSPIMTTFEYMYTRSMAGNSLFASGGTQAVQALSTINPIAPSTSANTTPGAFITQPGWKLQDNPWFRKHFKVTYEQKRKLTPGKNTVWIHRSRGTKKIHTGDLVDAVDQKTSNAWGMKVLALKGTRIYIWRIEPEAISNNAGTSGIPQAYVNFRIDMRNEAVNVAPDGDDWYVRNQASASATGYKIIEQNTTVSGTPIVAT